MAFALLKVFIKVLCYFILSDSQVAASFVSCFFLGPSVSPIPAFQCVVLFRWGFRVTGFYMVTGFGTLPKFFLFSFFLLFFSFWSLGVHIHA